MQDTNNSNQTEQVYTKEYKPKNINQNNPKRIIQTKKTYTISENQYIPTKPYQSTLTNPTQPTLKKLK